MEKQITNIFKKTRDRGFYHIRITIIFSLIFALCYVHNSILPFIKHTPNLIFNDSAGFEVKRIPTDEDCIYLKSHGMKYKLSEDSIKTLVTDLNLVCENNSLRYLNLVFFIGSFIGALIYFFIIDKIGRRTSLMVMILFYLIVFFAMFFSYNLLLMHFLYFMSGIGYGLIPNILVVYLTEITATGVRALYIAIIMFFQTFIQVICISLFNVFLNWRPFIIISSCLFLVAFIFCYYWV